MPLIVKVLHATTGNLQNLKPELLKRTSTSCRDLGTNWVVLVVLFFLFLKTEMSFLHLYHCIVLSDFRSPKDKLLKQVLWRLYRPQTEDSRLA